MDRPGELIRRASNRELRAVQQAHEQQEAVTERTENLPAPQPVSRHGSYTALMRSHDRVHTRHIADRR